MNRGNNKPVPQLYSQEAYSVPDSTNEEGASMHWLSSMERRKRINDGIENDSTPASFPNAGSAHGYPPYHVSASPLWHPSQPHTYDDPYRRESYPFPRDEQHGRIEYQHTGELTPPTKYTSIEVDAPFAEDDRGVGVVPSLPFDTPPAPAPSFAREEERRKAERKPSRVDHDAHHRSRRSHRRHVSPSHHRHSSLSPSAEHWTDSSYPPHSRHYSHYEEEEHPSAVRQRLASSSSFGSSSLAVFPQATPSFPSREDSASWLVPLRAPVLDIPIPWGAESSITFSESLLMDLLAAAVARGGPTVEEEVAKREETNPDFAFLQVEWKDPRSRYYRWRLYSLLQGDTLTKWRTDPFQLIAETEAYAWKPPPAILSASDYLLFASRGDLLSDSVSSVAWTTLEMLKDNTRMGTEGSSSSTNADGKVNSCNNNSNSSRNSSSPQKEEANSCPLVLQGSKEDKTLFPLPSIWRISREVPEKYSRLVGVLSDADANAWRQQIHLMCKKTANEERGADTCWVPLYTPLLTGSSSSAPSSTSEAASPILTVTEADLMVHWRAWLEDWHQHLFSGSCIGRNMMRAIDLSDGGKLAEHVLSILLDEVLRVAFENSAVLRRVIKKKAQSSVFTTIKVIEETCAAFAAHCLQLQWYLFTLHDILCNAIVEPLRGEEEVEAYIQKKKRRADAEAERKQRNGSVVGMNGKDSSSLGSLSKMAQNPCAALCMDNCSRNADEPEALLQFPPLPISERQEQDSAAAMALKARSQRRQSWSRGLEAILVPWIEATCLVVFNSLFITGNVEACAVKTELAAELELCMEGSTASSNTFASSCPSTAAAAPVVVSSSGVGGRIGITVPSMDAESDDAQRVKVEFSTTVARFLQTPSSSAPSSSTPSKDTPLHHTPMEESGSVSPCESRVVSPSSPRQGDTVSASFRHSSQYLNPGSDPHLRRLSEILKQNTLEMGLMVLTWLRFLLLQWHEGSYERNNEEEGMEGVEDEREKDLSLHGSLKRPRQKNPKEKPLVGLRIYSKIIERYPFLRYQSGH